MIIPPIGGVGTELTVTGAEGVTGSAQSSGASVGAGGTESTSFGSELTDAISSLEKTQQSGDSASQALATGAVKDPESAVVTVEDAQMAMELASQLRTKATEAVQNIFQTQV
jgi:flagellar hook-basal body complex protein FliE